MNMDNFLNLTSIILTIVCAFSIAFGANIKKWYGWLQVLAGFLLGLLVGTSQDVIGNMMTGVLFALLIIVFGPIVWKRRQSYKSLRRP
jgi:flagellar biosynthesis protein FlhB